MDDQNVLQHLLEVESLALTLVDDAQEEADRRVTEAEKQNRSRYDERYSKEAALLDEEYEKKLALVKEDYRKQLEEYRVSLDTMPINQEKFGQLLDTLLNKEG